MKYSNIYILDLYLFNEINWSEWTKGRALIFIIVGRAGRGRNKRRRRRRSWRTRDKGRAILFACCCFCCVFFCVCSVYILRGFFRIENLFWYKIVLFSAALDFLSHRTSWERQKESCMHACLLCLCLCVCLSLAQKPSSLLFTCIIIFINFSSYSSTSSSYFSSCAFS